MTWPLTKAVIALALVLFLGLFWWLPDILVAPAMRLTGAGEKEPDYWVQDFRITAMGDDGRPRFVLSANELTHYPGDTSTKLERPHLVQYDRDRMPIITVADAGRISPDGKNLVMTGNVRIQRPGDSDSAGGEVTSNEVSVTLN